MLDEEEDEDKEDDQEQGRVDKGENAHSQGNRDTGAQQDTKGLRKANNGGRGDCDFESRECEDGGQWDLSIRREILPDEID